MATLSGHRTAVRAAAVATVLLTAALTVGASPAYADGPKVEFSGGSVLSLLVCKSTPSASKVSVTEGDQVAFVNRLGQAASLKVNGNTVSQVPPNSQVSVHFTSRGADSVSMAFDCGVGVVQEFSAVDVSVAPAPNAAPAANRVGGGVAAAVGGAGGTVATHKPTPTAAGTSAGKTVTHPPTQGATPTRGTASTNATGGQSGTEPIDPSLLGPDLEPSDGAAVADPGATTGGNGQVYVEAAVPASGTPRNGPAGLLALIATVCVVGVGMAAIRAIIAKRATRTGLA
jgi:hypothetical protein